MFLKFLNLNLGCQFLLIKMTTRQIGPNTTTAETPSSFGTSSTSATRIRSAVDIYNLASYSIEFHFKIRSFFIVKWLSSFLKIGTIWRKIGASIFLMMTTNQQREKLFWRYEWLITVLQSYYRVFFHWFWVYLMEVTGGLWSWKYNLSTHWCIP